MKKTESASINTIIGEDTTINGSIQLHDNIIVYGKVLGDIESGETIRIASRAEIQGNLKGRNIQVSGFVRGNLQAQSKVVLNDQADVNGDVYAAQIVIEEGARFEGKCEMSGTSATSVTPEPET
jgi:cytoskeletal protein CcmA (bactofilin family)